MSTEAPVFAAPGPAGRWSVTAPVPESEQRHVNSDGYGQAAGRFLTTQLRLRPWSKGVTYTLSGPNIRQDGTLGARTLTVEVTREHVENNYPATWEAARQMLAAGTAAISAEADMACDEINHVISGEAS
jgi:hypothetical protein